MRQRKVAITLSHSHVYNIHGDFQEDQLAVECYVKRKDTKRQKAKKITFDCISHNDTPN